MRNPHSLITALAFLHLTAVNSQVCPDTRKSPVTLNFADIATGQNVHNKVTQETSEPLTCKPVTFPSDNRLQAFSGQRSVGHLSASDFEEYLKSKQLDSQTERLHRILAVKPVCNQPAAYSCCHNFSFTGMCILASTAASCRGGGTALLQTIDQVLERGHSSAGILRHDQNGHNCHASHQVTFTG